MPDEFASADAQMLAALANLVEVAWGTSGRRGAELYLFCAEQLEMTRLNLLRIHEHLAREAAEVEREAAVVER